MQSKTVVSRFAPSPTGYLHLGHAYSALFSYERAMSSSGQFLLRIEDIDQGRSRIEFEQQIFEDLGWLGLAWPNPVRRQSEHFKDYKAALGTLLSLGLVYPCFCTRKEIQTEIKAAGGAPHGPDGPIYPGTCRKISDDQRSTLIDQGRAYAYRLDMEKSLARTGSLTWQDAIAGNVKANPEKFGDVVIARKDTPTSYHLAVTVDDHLQDVTLVTRGRDLFKATDIHCLLQNLLNLNTPNYHHHALILDDDGGRLAKRHDSVSIKTLREAGVSPEEIRMMISKGLHD